MDKNINILREIESELKEAAKLNPCPGCKHDTELLAKFVSAKIYSLENGFDINKDIIKSLKEVDYINELTGLAIVFSKFIRPLTRVANIPKIYEKILKEDTLANKKVMRHLLKASKLVKKLKGNDSQFKLISDVLKAFIGAMAFKLSIDSYAFYLFDRTIKLGYKTHILSITSKFIVGIKGALNPLRYK